MFEIELICIKMDLVLNNLQRLICHKTQPINHHEQDVTQGQFFKWTMAGLNSELSFSYNSWLPQSALLFTNSWRKNRWIHAFPKSISVKWNQTVQHVHCSWRRILRRGLEFHVCTINKSTHTKKVGKLISWSSYIYIYIYIYTHTHTCIFVCLHNLW